MYFGNLYQRKWKQIQIDLHLSLLFDGEISGNNMSRDFFAIVSPQSLWCSFTYATIDATPDSLVGSMWKKDVLKQR